VSAIIAQHKGTVEVLDTPGGGATFRVVLPLLPQDYIAPSSTASKNQPAQQTPST
jgi:two-component system OmpR family sensor kinase